MKKRTFDVLHRGVEPAVLAGLPQVLIPKLEERLLLHGRESADLGPRLIETLAQDRLRLRPRTGGLALASLIYLITFPRWGLAVRIGTEKHPRKRPLRIKAAPATAPFVFGLTTGLIYGHGPERAAGTA